eukprot:7340761-Prymnesium_polylepis.1
MTNESLLSDVVVSAAPPYFFGGSACARELIGSVSNGHAEARRPRVRCAGRAGERFMFFRRNSRRRRRLSCRIGQGARRNRASAGA